MQGLILIMLIAIFFLCIIDFALGTKLLSEKNATLQKIEENQKKIMKALGIEE